MKDYIVENQGLINQRDYLQLSLVVAEHTRDINAIKSSLSTIDNYIGVKTLALLKNSKENVKIILFSDNVGSGLHSSEFNDFCKQYPDCKIELKQTAIG